MLRKLVLALLLGISLLGFGQMKDPHLKKLSPYLQRLVTGQTSSDSIDVSVSTSGGFRPGGNARILYTPVPGFISVIRIPTGNLPSLAQNQQVLFINGLRQPKEEVNTGASDPTLNLITYAQHRFPQVRGDSIRASVKERRFDTADIDLKGRIFFTGLEDNAVTTHASLMATIVAGAANSSPFARGAAPAANVISSSFTNLFPDADSVFQRYHISVQNHSYGTAVENFYGNEAVAYDQNAINNPGLLHVFSAGNSGNITNSSGPYAGVTNNANLTGDFKQAKNIITVRAVDSAGQLLLLSSKGPAYDGRVKPELVAYGEDGSSGAAALTSGAAVLVQNQYAQLHGGQVPPSFLVKAVLLNSAGEAGAPHIDYASGYGLLNAFAALQTISEGHFFTDSVAQNQTRSFSVTVPANAAQLKLTLVWNDPPAAPNAAKALVNDLDLTVRSAAGESWLPWVLNPEPGLSAVQAPATRGTDTLNNVEQVTIENPAAGTYTIEVKATRLVTARQSFALAFQTDTTNTFYWTYPTSTDHLVAGSTQALRWQSNSKGPGRVEYATTGNNWREVGAVSDLSKNILKWNVPDTFATVQLRMITSSNSILSDTVTISPQQNLKTGFDCVDSFLLYWKALPVDRYRLYNLGDRYLQHFLSLPDTAVVLQKSQSLSEYFAIAPLINGKEGIRSNTINYHYQGVGCYIKSFYLQTQTATAASFVAEIGSVYNVAAVSLEMFDGSRFVTLQQVASPKTTTFNFSNVALHPGANLFRFAVTLVNGATLYSNIETAYAVGTTAPVVFYPNPVPQSGTIHIIVGEVGRYALQFFDATGKLVYKTDLNSTVTEIPASRFAKGLYLITIFDMDKKTGTHKQIVL